MFLKFLCVFAIISVSNSAEERLKVSVYFESLCGCCRSFVLNQLYPGYKILGDSLLLDLVPLGHEAHVVDNGNITWFCQHGPLECYVNKLNACAIKVTTTQAPLMEFMNCLISGASYLNTQEKQEAIAIQCAAQSQISWDEINTCVKSSTSDEILLDYEERQNNTLPKLDDFPSIRFNDEFNETHDNAAKDDFVGTACQLFKQKPKACEQQ